jgi:ABC-type spermidine/putrescine transport system permease subunit II
MKKRVKKGIYGFPEWLSLILCVLLLSPDIRLKLKTLIFFSAAQQNSTRLKINFIHSHIFIRIVVVVVVVAVTMTMGKEI